MNKKYFKYIVIGFILMVILGGYVSFKINNKEISNNDSKEVDVLNKKDIAIEKVDSGRDIINDKKEVTKVNVKEIPVIMYHSIDYEKGNQLRVPKDNFRNQMQYLKDNGYSTLSLDELYDFIKNGSEVPEKPVVLTFDDGYVDNYNNAYPIIKELGLKATVFVITSCIDNDKKFLTSEQIKEMDANGFRVESHTANHDKLTEIPYNEQVKTLKESKEFLDGILKRDIKYIAYPYGLWNSDTLKCLEETGYKMGFTTNSGWNNRENGTYVLNRIYIKASATMEEFIYRLTNSDYDK